MDTAGLYYMVNARGRGSAGNNAPNAAPNVDDESMCEAMDRLEDGMDADLYRKGVIRNNTNPKCRNKGPRPTDKDQKLWAPFLYFVNSVAGSLVAMMHKLGMYRLRINYGVFQISQYLFDNATSTLADLIHQGDGASAARYYTSYQCR